MGRSAFVPKELKAGPFTRADAARAGLSRWHLEGANWRRMGRLYSFGPAYPTLLN
jgi:hypothetical protein